MKIEKPHFLQPDGLIDNASPRELYSLWNALVDSNNAQEEHIQKLSNKVASLERELRQHAGPGHAEPDLRGLW